MRHHHIIAMKPTSKLDDSESKRRIEEFLERQRRERKMDEISSWIVIVLFLIGPAALIIVAIVRLAMAVW
jgi:hypothetical protein